MCWCRYKVNNKKVPGLSKACSILIWVHRIRWASQIFPTEKFGRSSKLKLKATIRLKILKLTNKCKFKYLRQRLGKSFHVTRCQVVKNEVWLCFRQGDSRSCDSWTKEKLSQSLTLSRSVYMVSRGNLCSISYDS